NLRAPASVKLDRPATAPNQRSLKSRGLRGPETRRCVQQFFRRRASKHARPHSLGGPRARPKVERGASEMLRHTKVFLLLCALALACVARQAAAQTRVPPINLKERTLANGLKVYSAQERSSPTVAIQVWYRVGSKDDPPSRSG